MSGDFGRRVSGALRERGLSIRAASRRISYDPAYLSRVLSGRQRPSAQLALALDDLLDMGGTLVGLSDVAPEAGRSRGSEPDHFDGKAYVRSTVGFLLDHDTRFGGEHVADAALQVWRAEQRKLDRAMDPAPEYVSAVAEVAEVAGWIAFDAERQADARLAFMESWKMATLAGDRQRAWFALDMMAMQDVQQERPGAVLRVADGLLSVPGLPPRVATIARVRRARALAQAGDRRRSLDEMERARGGLQDSMTSSDPEWTWWVTDTELTGHHGEVLLSLGEPAASASFMREARMSVPPGERGEFYYAVAELDALAHADAWRDCEHLLTELLPPLLTTVASTRSRTRLTRTLRAIRRDAPPWLAGMARDVDTSI